MSHEISYADGADDNLTHLKVVLRESIGHLLLEARQKSFLDPPFGR
jgi:hypothetical protein